MVHGARNKKETKLVFAFLDGVPFFLASVVGVMVVVVVVVACVTCGLCELAGAFCRREA